MHCPPDIDIIYLVSFAPQMEVFRFQEFYEKEIMLMSNPGVDESNILPRYRVLRGNFHRALSRLGD
jgi:hypothetical protein